MDANELQARTLFAQARQGAATGAATDEASATIIREAQAAARREKEREFIQQDEIFAEFGTRTTEVPIFLTLQTLNWTTA